MDGDCVGKIPEAMKPTIKINGYSEEVNEEKLKMTLTKQNPILQSAKHFQLKKGYCNENM